MEVKDKDNYRSDKTRSFENIARAGVVFHQPPAGGVKDDPLYWEQNQSSQGYVGECKEERVHERR